MSDSGTTNQPVQPPDVDFVASLLAEFCRLTGKLAETSEDYALAVRWEQQGIPLSIALAGIHDKLDRAAGKPWVRRCRLAWCDDDVQQTFHDWRRAVGPSYASILQSERSASASTPLTGDSH